MQELERSSKSDRDQSMGGDANEPVEEAAAALEQEQELMAAAFGEEGSEQDPKEAEAGD